MKKSPKASRHNSPEPDGEDDGSSSLSSLFAEDADLDTEDVHPLLPEVSHSGRPPRGPSVRDSPAALLRSSAPVAGCATTEIYNLDLEHERLMQSRLATVRRSEENATSRLAKSLSTAHLMSGPGAQSGDGVNFGSDGGVLLGVAHVSTVSDLSSSGLQAAAQMWAVASSAARLPSSSHLGASTSTPLGAVVLPGPGTAATVSGLMTPGSAGHAGGAVTAAGCGGGAGSAGGGGAATGGGGALFSASTGTTPLPPLSHPRHPALSAGANEEVLQSLEAYVRAEAQPAEKLPTADVVWGQTERERVYNFLLHVPYQLERLIWFGSLLLVDSFLGVFTLLPLRCVVAVLQVLSGFLSLLSPASWRGSRGTGAGGRLPAVPESSAPSCGPGAGTSLHTRTGSVSGPAAAAAAAATPIAGAAAPAAPPGRRPRSSASSRLSGSQLYDMLCLAILFAATAVLRAVRPGAIYYWLKDITSEFLKMSVLSTAFDISDKILSNFGNDVLEALSGTCTQWLAGKKPVGHVAADTLVAATIVTLHALTLMCQALIVAVALNSSRNGLVALLIANNFVEIKSTVFKKWDSTRIWALVCADAVERFHLLVVLSFVVVEEMDSAASWSPPPDYLRVCGLMVAAEVVIDVVKHAVLGKFNDVRPGIYREFHADLCTKALAAQSHSAPRLLNFHHLAPAALTMRMLVTLFWLRVETRAQVWPRLLIVAALYTSLCGAKLLFGYCIKLVAHYHLCYYNRKYGAKAYGSRASTTARATVNTTAAVAAAAAAGAPVPPTPGSNVAPAAGSGAFGAAAHGGGLPSAPSGGPSVHLLAHAILAASSSSTATPNGPPSPGGLLLPVPQSPAHGRSPGVASARTMATPQPLLLPLMPSLPDPTMPGGVLAGSDGGGALTAGTMSPTPLVKPSLRRLSGPVAGLGGGIATGGGSGSVSGYGFGAAGAQRTGQEVRAGLGTSLLAALSGMGPGAGAGQWQEQGHVKVE